MLSGALTLSIMILPLIMRTTEALLSVPDMYREELWAGRGGGCDGAYRAAYGHPGILGCILAIGRSWAKRPR